MRPTAAVYIATSLDGYISRADGSIDWLTPFEDPDVFVRFNEFLSSVHAIVMGRNTFLQVLGFDAWPYGEAPVYVMSWSIRSLPSGSPSTVQIRACTPEQLLAELESAGCKRAYIDGGATIQSFFEKDLIDELTITRIPVLLVYGLTLFGPVPTDLGFTHVETQTFASGMVQTRYVRERR